MSAAESQLRRANGEMCGGCDSRAWSFCTRCGRCAHCCFGTTCWDVEPVAAPLSWSSALQAVRLGTFVSTPCGGCGAKWPQGGAESCPSCGWPLDAHAATAFVAPATSAPFAPLREVVNGSELGAAHVRRDDAFLEMKRDRDNMEHFLRHCVTGLLPVELRGLGVEVATSCPCNRLQCVEARLNAVRAATKK